MAASFICLCRFVFSCEFTLYFFYFYVNYANYISDVPGSPDWEQMRAGRRWALAYLPWAFKIRTMAIMVFQFRVVAGTPNSLSIRPR